MQAAQIELQEVVRGRKEVAETDCAEVRLTEKSKAAAGEKVRERRSRIWREKQWVNKSTIGWDMRIF